ncbi:MAG: gamma-glutamyl-gamma-aminobutyrate hydrolase family protein [Rhodospirillaceae bacterium]|nr:gamma-glutamyl-gamma-aminobutyrate hydrolase family protein [Rhodospirillaceae bacterium]MBT5512734.1 gamma-glutamyl-gamma-aminobutyrate hydrolase family protein [Rhodospirillaceae bacterium]MBT7247847.1 gamma-glutamyl-gamma-aminobutyrate hydrolase family protein [Rhodospirillaceae bacterium]
MTTRPTIGILLDYQEEGGFSSRPHYALRCGYFDAIWRAGGLPVALPYLEQARADYLGLCDALILPGGFYPFPAALYGDPEPVDEIVHPRYRFEAELAAQALTEDIPMLGICAGMQVIAAAKGATLYRDVRDELPTDIDHLNEKPAEEYAHGVEITPGTRLRALLGVDDLAVNTAHKEALKDTADGLVINAVATDGVVEGIELPDQRFCIGVQWHPEFFAEHNDPNFNLFAGLVDAAGSR